MKIKLFLEFLDKLRNLIDFESHKGKNVLIYEKNSNPLKFFEHLKVKVELNKHKDIILEDETSLELGGIKRKSFSLVYPSSNQDFINHINNGRITLIGLESKDILDFSTDFGMILLIGVNNINKKDFESLKQFNLVSNGIEGFLIRTIPRKFWCRISKNIRPHFSFEFLGNAIFYLYNQRFKDLTVTMEIFLINSYPDLIDEIIEISSKIAVAQNKKWLKKIEKWKKKIDCEYDWGCEICPYRKECYGIKQVLVERERLR